MKRMGWMMAAAALSAGVGWAGDTYKVEYVSGKAGFEKKVKGHLTIDEKEVRLDDGKGRLVFTIPIDIVDKATAGTEHEGGSFGRKMALGIFASKDQEYLQIETHTSSSAEVVVFKVKKKTGPGMAAKINFWAGKVPSEQPVTSEPLPQPVEGPR